MDLGHDARAAASRAHSMWVSPQPVQDVAVDVDADAGGLDVAQAGLAEVPWAAKALAAHGADVAIGVLIDSVIGEGVHLVAPGPCQR